MISSPSFEGTENSAPDGNSTERSRSIQHSISSSSTCTTSSEEESSDLSEKSREPERWHAHVAALFRCTKCPENHTGKGYFLRVDPPQTKFFEHERIESRRRSAVIGGGNTFREREISQISSASSSGIGTTMQSTPVPQSSVVSTKKIGSCKISPIVGPSTRQCLESEITEDSFGSYGSTDDSFDES